MLGINRTHYLGSVASPPELKYTPAGLAILELTVAGRGEVVTADKRIKADVYIEDETVTDIGENLQVPDGTEVIDESICSGSSAFDGGCDPSYVLALEHGAAYLGVLLLLAVGVSLLSFTRRDIS